jgi:hypothetical protein
MADQAVYTGPSQPAVEDEEDEQQDNPVHHRLRANSSIMQLKKILGASVLHIVNLSWFRLMN